jgi:hypothetical protein
MKVVTLPLTSLAFSANARASFGMHRRQAQVFEVGLQEQRVRFGHEWAAAGQGAGPQGGKPRVNATRQASFE